MKGICFKEPLFHLTIEGWKTQTRRIMQPQPYGDVQFSQSCKIWMDRYSVSSNYNTCIEIKPRYKVGEVVYLKEPYCHECAEFERTDYTEYVDNGKFVYKYAGHYLADNKNSPFGKWQNKLFMPTDAARYFIKITAIRAERLQNISEEDCIREGIISEYDSCGYLHYHNSTRPEGRKEKLEAHFGTMVNGYLSIGYKTPQAAYSALINKINGKGTWVSNPFVWVYDYELTEKIE